MSPGVLAKNQVLGPGPCKSAGSLSHSRPLASSACPIPPESSATASSAAARVLLAEVLMKQVPAPLTTLLRLVLLIDISRDSQNQQ